MEFADLYRLMSFKAYLSKVEDAERHLFHECGHEFLAIQLGAQIKSLHINPGGVSQIDISGIKSLGDSYRIGVAGMLAEARGTLPPWHSDFNLDLDRMPQFAKGLIEALSPHKENKDYGIYPDVPIQSRMPSTNWAELSVIDLWTPFQSGISESGLSDALVDVSSRFNSPSEWGRFLEHVKSRRKQT